MSDKGTEQATAQRKKKAKEQGDSVRSRELLSAVAMLGGVMTLGGLTQKFVSGWSHVYEESLKVQVGQDGLDTVIIDSMRKMLVPALLPVAAVMAASFAGALFTGVAQGGGVVLG